MNYPKEYTVKEWKKFNHEIDGSQIGNSYQFFNFFTQRMESFESVTAQEILLQKYDVILTDYKTKKEKLFGVLDKFNAKNINKGIDKFNKGMDQFSKVVASSSGGKSKPRKMGISQKDYDSLFKSKKRGNSTNFWNEDKKTRKKRNRRKKPVQQTDYSFLTGGSKKRVKFF